MESQLSSTIGPISWALIGCRNCPLCLLRPPMRGTERCDGALRLTVGVAVDFVSRAALVPLQALSDLAALAAAGIVLRLPLALVRVGAHV